MVSESTWRVHVVIRFILIRNYNGFVVDMDSLGWIMFEFTKEFQRFLSGCRLSYTSVLQATSRYEIDQNGFRCSETKKCSQRFEIDHFCPGKISSLEPSKNGCESNRGTLRFIISISDILMAPSCSLRSFLEVGVSWAASRYSFRNLWFKHRGMQLGVQCSITYLIAYPYAWTLNFGNCIDLQLTTLVHKSDKSPPPTSLSSFSLVL